MKFDPNDEQEVNAAALEFHRAFHEVANRVVAGIMHAYPDKSPDERIEIHERFLQAVLVRFDQLRQAGSCGIGNA